MKENEEATLTPREGEFVCGAASPPVDLRASAADQREALCPNPMQLEGLWGSESLFVRGSSSLSLSVVEKKHMEIILL